MFRLAAIASIFLLAGCAEDRCNVSRRMNCEGLATADLDQAYDQCNACSEVMSPAHLEVSDCFVACVAEKIEYSCSETFWDDGCALDCTAESTVEAARMQLLEIESHRLLLSACRG